ncbi:hypothetical protein [Sutcliffiella sp. NC1]|uniref:hypothetical protein n=1 Tax=Sutcliffiella sp. NC1 TaxID=3004096 RepID=UPI0022DE90E7|nr:hypothetical protein [Sutcliffiella sp. NC1]WBL16954.1 hypothetical protein O1A01_10110 [Sutcliffiella sp. NC1]
MYSGEIKKLALPFMIVLLFLTFAFTSIINFGMNDSVAFQEIKQGAKQVIEENMDKTFIGHIEVMEDDNLIDGGYVVTSHLKYENTDINETKQIIEFYSDQLANELADYNVNKVTVFWEVPHLEKDDNLARFHFQRNGEKIQMKERWFALSFKDT